MISYYVGVSRGGLEDLILALPLDAKIYRVYVVVNELNPDFRAFAIRVQLNMTEEEAEGLLQKLRDRRLLEYYDKVSRN